ncbi:hypothetical protein D3C80_1395720 [compost metagenome]
MMTPAMRKAPRNCSRPMPTPATCASSCLATPCRCGVTWCSTPMKSVARRSQSLCSGWPISGQPRMASGGRGIFRVRFCTACTASPTDSAMEVPSTATGTSRITRPIRMISVDALTSLPPNQRQKICCRGYRVIARITAHSIRSRKGWKMRKQNSASRRISPARISTSSRLRDSNFSEGGSMRSLLVRHAVSQS